MKKIPRLFKREHEYTKLVINEVIPASQWVINGEGVATEKIDGTACLIQNGNLYRRYTRRITRIARRRGPPYTMEDYKPAPPSWQGCEDTPDMHTGHWPGWIPVDDNEAQDRWHREAFNHLINQGSINDGTYELVGPKVQGNPYGFHDHKLFLHGTTKHDCPRTYDLLKSWLASMPIEGIVWHHPDGRMAKIKRKDFGLPWPLTKAR